MKKEDLVKIISLGVISLIAALVIKPFILIIALAAIVAYSFYPVHKFLIRKLHPVLSSLIITSSVIAVLVTAIQFGTNLALKEIGTAYRLLTSIKYDQLSPYLEDLMRRVLEQFVSWFSHQIIAIPELILSMIIFFIGMFYFLYDGKKFYDTLIQISPLNKNEQESIFKGITKSIDSFVYIQLLIGIIQGLLAAFCFYIFGIKYILFGAILAGILSILPLMGSFWLYLFIAIAFILNGSLWMGIGVIVYGLGLSATLDAIIKPILFGKRMKIHPLTSFIGIFGGLKVFGVVGIIIGPIIISIAITLWSEFLKRYKDEAK